MKRLPPIAMAVLLAAHCLPLSAAPYFKVLNGEFENGLKSWNAIGNVHLDTNGPLAGKASAVIGPGVGSLSQRVEIGSGNDFTLSATIQPQLTNGWVFAIRFLDRKGHEVMRVDSLSDMERDKKDPRKFAHYMKAHPLTKWIEIVLTNDSSTGTVEMDQVGLDITDANAAGLKPAWDLDDAMQPFWLGHRVNREALLMFSQDGKPASGQLMFQPSRIISVQDYGGTTNYSEGVDYIVRGRNLVRTGSSRMTQVRAEDLLKGEYQWNVVGGKQVMVTYEHDAGWNHPAPYFVGNDLPNTLRKLNGRAPLTVVAYGDSITHGLGESRLSGIRPYLPPWPELFVHRLKELYQDQHIEFYNSAQSGADSKWAEKYAERMVSSLNPDLVIIAFGQNDFWSLSADTFANNISNVVNTVRNRNPEAEFLLVSTMRFDPTYTTNAQYWSVVGDYSAKLKSMTRPGVQFVDMTKISEWVYAAKKPKDCLNDPLHPNDYLARWYAQSLAAVLDPSAR